MGWQDRDYARNEPRGHARRPSGSWIGGSRPRSIVTTLIVVNVVVFVLQVMTTAPGHSPVYSTVGRLGAMTTDLVLRGEVWRLFTAQYLHANGNHILFNMIGLYFLGKALERIWSPKKFLVIYTLAGLAGNLSYLLLSLGGWFGWISTKVPLVGASGCILGLLGVVAVLFPRAEVYVYFLFPVKIRTAAVVFGGLYALNIWQRGSNAGGDAAHLAGLAFGVWWAAMGDRWWAARGSRVLAGLTGKVGAAPKPGPGAWHRNMDQRKADAELIDKLLAKVYEGGLHSLTPAERKALTEATDRQRRQEQQAGRTDRL